MKDRDQRSGAHLAVRGADSTTSCRHTPLGCVAFNRRSRAPRARAASGWSRSTRWPAPSIVTISARAPTPSAKRRAYANGITRSSLPPDQQCRGDDAMQATRETAVAERPEQARRGLARARERDRPLGRDPRPRAASRAGRRPIGVLAQQRRASASCLTAKTSVVGSAASKRPNGATSTRRRTRRPRECGDLGREHAADRSPDRSVPSRPAPSSRSSVAAIQSAMSSRLLVSERAREAGQRRTTITRRRAARASRNGVQRGSAAETREEAERLAAPFSHTRQR